MRPRGMDLTAGIYARILRSLSQNPPARFRQPRHLFGGETEVVGDQRWWVRREPSGQRDFFVDRAVEQDKNPRRFVADLLHEMPETLFDEGDLALRKFFGRHSAVRAKDGHARPP